MMTGFFLYQDISVYHSILRDLNTGNNASAYEKSDRLPEGMKQLVRGYLAYLAGEYETSFTNRTIASSWAQSNIPESLYNLGTLEAILATTGRDVTMYDFTWLQRATTHLQAEIDRSPDQRYAKHNLEVVKQLLAQNPNQEQQQQQQQQDQSWSEWEEEEESQDGQSDQQEGSQEGQEWDEAEKSENWSDDQSSEEWSKPDSSLSDQQREQLQQYQQYIEQQQLQNQQFFGKEQPATNGSDPFDLLFGGERNLQQNISQTDRDR